MCMGGILAPIWAFNEAGQYPLRQEVYSYAVLVGISALSLGATASKMGLDWGLPIWLFALSPAFETARWYLRDRNQVIEQNEQLKDR